MFIIKKVYSAIYILFIYFKEEFFMKKLWLTLTAVILVVCCSLNVCAAEGEDLLNSADVHITFDEKIEDANENYELYIEGDIELVDGRFGTAGNIISGLNFISVEELKFGTDSFTVSTWINTHEHSGDPVLFGNKDWNKGANTGFLLALRNNDWKYNANSVDGTRTDTEYPFNAAPIESELETWYHLAIVVDRAANTYTLYVNGVKYGFSTDFADKAHAGTYDDEVNQYQFSIGEDGTTIYNMGQTLNVDFDEFAVWKKALTADEIVAVYTYAPEGEEAAVVESSDANEPLVFTSDAKEVLSTADVHVAFDGTVEDLTGNYTVTSVGETAFAEGKANQAAVVKSGVNYLTVDGFKFGADSFTISTWLNCREFSSDPVIIGNKDWGSGANPGIALYYKNANWQYNMNTAEGSRSDDTYAIATSGAASQFNEWINVTIVVDREAQTSTFYVNGRPYGDVSDLSDNAFTSALDDETNNYPLTIGEDGTGAYNSANAAFNVEYDELVIWKKALTADEVASVYTYVADGSAASAEVPAAPAETAAPETEAPETEAPETEAVAETEAPETEAVVETEAPETAAPETEAEVVEAPAAPQTFDFGVIAAIAAIISAAGYAVSRKR